MRGRLYRSAFHRPWKRKRGIYRKPVLLQQKQRGIELICKDTAAEDGTVSLAFTHASDYVIAIDGEEGVAATGPEQPETQDEDREGTAEDSL